MVSENPKLIDLPVEIHAQFRRSNFCRVIHVDGAYGGLSPQLGIYMALFSERVALPDVQTYEVSADGRAVQKAEPAVHDVTRDIEVEALMSLDVAKSLVQWLSGKIDEGEALRASRTPQA